MTQRANTRRAKYMTYQAECEAYSVMRLGISMSISEPWLSDDKELIQQIERELDAFEEAELAFRARERREREETVKVLLNGHLSPDEPAEEESAYH